jgi:hypothetical protein
MRRDYSTAGAFEPSTKGFDYMKSRLPYYFSRSRKLDGVDFLHAVEPLLGLASFTTIYSYPSLISYNIIIFSPTSNSTLNNAYEQFTPSRWLPAGLRPSPEPGKGVKGQLGKIMPMPEALLERV